MLLVVYIALIGLVVGSAINAIVWRLYVGRKWSKGRSMCPECKHVLAPKDLIPIVSWLWLRGKCRYCRAPIKDSPVVEAVTALAFGLSAYQLPVASTWSAALLAAWLLVLTLLIIMAVYDARWLILPDKIMFPAIGAAIVLLGLRVAASHSWITARGPIVAALLAGAIFLAIVVVSKGRAMGGGDIKLAFLMGLLLGLRGTALAMLVAFNVAAVISLLLIALKKRGRRDQIPFGPFLVFGTTVAYIYGAPIIHWYVHANALG